MHENPSMSSPALLAQAHGEPSSTIPSAQGQKGAQQLQRHSGKTDLKARMAVAAPQKTHSTVSRWLLHPPAHTRRHTTERQLKTVPCQHFYHNTYIFICRRYNFQPENNPILTHSQHRSILLHLSWRGWSLLTPLHMHNTIPAPLLSDFPRDKK